MEIGYSSNGELIAFHPYVFNNKVSFVIMLLLTGEDNFCCFVPLEDYS